jgi:hypothetical protein
VGVRLRRGVGAAAVSDETMALAGDIAGLLYDHFFSSSRRWWTFSGDRYEIADDDQYAALGEDPTKLDLPLILVRESDGKFFQVDLDVSAQETTAAARLEQLEQLRKLRAGKAGTS